MSFIVGDDGRLEVGPPDDPVRQSHDLIIRKLAAKFELDQQLFECTDSQLETLKARASELEATVARLVTTVGLLEGLITGIAA